jgi:hypothetical protein
VTHAVAARPARHLGQVLQAAGVVICRALGEACAMFSLAPGSGPTERDR